MSEDAAPGADDVPPSDAADDDPPTDAAAENHAAAADRAATEERTYDTTVEHLGTEVSRVGLGTFRMEGRECYDAVLSALEMGYRHVDTAQMYDNEREVGRAIAHADIDREDVFLTTKVHPRNRHFDDVIDSVDDSLQRLGVESVDLLLIHWPNPLADTGEVMDALNAARDDGKTRHIGVSNFGVDRLRNAQRLSDAPIFADQVQFHPFYPQRELLRYCQDEDVLLTAYSPLAEGALVDDTMLNRVGDAYGKTAAQVAIRWATQHENVITIPKSTDETHLRENLDVFDFALTEDEMDAIARPSYLRTGLSMLRTRLDV